MGILNFKSFIRWYSIPAWDLNVLFSFSYTQLGRQSDDYYFLALNLCFPPTLNIGLLFRRCVQCPDVWLTRCNLYLWVCLYYTLFPTQYSSSFFPNPVSNKIFIFNFFYFHPYSKYRSCEHVEALFNIILLPKSIDATNILSIAA